MEKNTHTNCYIYCKTQNKAFASTYKKQIQAYGKRLDFSCIRKFLLKLLKLYYLSQNKQYERQLLLYVSSLVTEHIFMHIRTKISNLHNSWMESTFVCLISNLDDFQIIFRRQAVQTSGICKNFVG